MHVWMSSGVNILSVCVALFVLCLSLCSFELCTRPCATPVAVPIRTFEVMSVRLCVPVLIHTCMHSRIAGGSWSTAIIATTTMPRRLESATTRTSPPRELEAVAALVVTDGRRLQKWQGK